MTRRSKTNDDVGTRARWIVLNNEFPDDRRRGARAPRDCERPHGPSQIDSRSRRNFSRDRRVRRAPPQTRTRAPGVMLAGIRSAAASVLGRGGRKRKADEAGAPEEDDRRASRRRIVPSEAGVRARKTKREGKASGAGGGDVADERRGSPYLTRLRRLWHRDSSGDDGSLACASPALRAKAAARPRLSRWELRDVGVDVLDLLVDAMLCACSPPTSPTPRRRARPGGRCSARAPPCDARSP